MIHSRNLIKSVRIADLREKISQTERLAEKPWPMVRLGAKEMDDALPGGGLALGSVQECLPACHGDFSVMLGFGLGLLARILKARPGPVLWALPAYQQRAWGRLYAPGLAGFGIDMERIVHVEAPKTQTMLWALEEALGHPSLSAVIGVLPENDETYDFTASRRLAMRAARHGVTALVLSSSPGFSMATAADMRWSVAADASAAVHRRGQAVPGLGPPRFAVNLIKSKKGQSGRWTMEWDHETLSFRLAAPLADRAPVRVSGSASGQWAAA